MYNPLLELIISLNFRYSPVFLALHHSASNTQPDLDKKIQYGQSPHESSLTKFQLVSTTGKQNFKGKLFQEHKTLYG